MEALLLGHTALHFLLFETHSTHLIIQVVTQRSQEPK